MFVEYTVPNGVAKVTPPENSRSPLRVWQLAQFPATARYLPRSVWSFRAIVSAYESHCQ